MFRNGKAFITTALTVTVAGAALAGCGTDAISGPLKSAAKEDQDLFTGTQKIKVDGQSVNVSCSGGLAVKRPVIVLMHGGGDDLKKMAGLQKSLSKEDRVCSYDRLGAGASDKPDGPQTLDSSGKILSGVIDHVAADTEVVLAGHSLGGLIAARYAPDHQDKVTGLVMMDATSPTQNDDLTKGIPESAKGPAVELREQTLGILQGKGPEKLTVPDGEVRSAGDIPVEVVQHGKQYLAAVPEYGPDLETAWAEGQRKWLGVSSESKLSTAKNSEHYIYVDEPKVAVKAIQGVAAKASKL
ncbi:serine aminopeptidase S33 family [Murinocardiopsis flavida]|uniref:Serine aminopeptidase S33 family n=1 Tax=Murinocardiopsis flavida TaxID=645275 RepID=A0A2P8CWU2_9ACTN|nr:alpha/beta fold hydrolase [Murinocardiopsis flavida]PSK89420.1 serine aminopeptidase S33 family [Murinocardiopsis flavida]